MLVFWRVKLRPERHLVPEMFTNVSNVWCIYVCMYECMDDVCMYDAHTCILVYYIYTNKCVCVYTKKCARVYTNTCACVYTNKCACVYTNKCVCVYKNKCVRMVGRRLFDRYPSSKVVLKTVRIS
jgi:hypothetical protein